MTPLTRTTTPTSNTPAGSLERLIGLDELSLAALLTTIVGAEVEELELLYDGLRITIRRSPGPVSSGAAGSTDTDGPEAPYDAMVAVSSPGVGSFSKLVHLDEVVTRGQKVGEIGTLGMRTPVFAPCDGVIAELFDDGQLAAVGFGNRLMTLRASQHS